MKKKICETGMMSRQKPISNVIQVLECSPGAVARSELQLSLTLNPHLQRLNIGVFEGRHLQDINKNEGVYVKVVLLQVGWWLGHTAS